MRGRVRRVGLVPPRRTTAELAGGDSHLDTGEGVTLGVAVGLHSRSIEIEASGICALRSRFSILSATRSGLPFARERLAMRALTGGLYPMK